jgi:Cu2+-exporting ATPase
MATSTFDDGDLFSILGAAGSERQLRRIVGVGRVSVNQITGSTTVVYDPKKRTLLRSRWR